jgi:CRP/FNR family transcriptional regulator
MQESLKNVPTFLWVIQDIENNSSIQSYKTGDVIMRTGQYINNTMLVTRQQDFWGRGENGWRILNVLFVGQACAVSVCATKSRTSQIMAEPLMTLELI